MLVTVHGTQSFQKMMIKSVDESILQFVETTAGTALILILINFKIDAVGSGSMRIVWDKFGLYGTFTKLKTDNLSPVFLYYTGTWYRYRTWYKQ